MSTTPPLRAAILRVTAFAAGLDDGPGGCAI